MKSLVVACCAASSVLKLSAAPSQTATWNNANVGNSVTNAAEWFSASWDSGSPPNDGDWLASILTSATGSRYVKIGQPLTIGAVSTLTFDSSSANSVNFVSDYPITLAQGNDSSRWYTISGGRWFADWTSSGSQCGVGYTHHAEFNGRIETPRFTLASGIGYIRLDHFAKSSDPMRTNDFAVTSLYRGSSHVYVMGPRKGTAHSGTWHVTAGSPYVFRTGTTPAIAAGAVVTCGDVFPAGTFVKRVFSDTCIELSAAASGTAETGDKTLSFAAITPHARITIPDMWMATYVSSYTSFATPDADGDFRVEVQSLTAGSTDTSHGPYRFCPHTNFGTYPATIVIHDAAGGGSDRHSSAHARNLLLEMGKCHLEFAETGREGARSGIPQGTAMSFASGTTRITVTNGIDAAIGLVTNFYNTIVKDGAGSLELGLTNDVVRNTGKIEIREGAVVMPEGAWVKTVAVSNGAALKVNGVFDVADLTLAPGARIGGSGTIVLQKPSDIDGIVFEDDVTVKFRVNTDGGFVRSVPDYRVVGTPAFWVDASQVSTMTFKDDDGVNIARVNDVRKTSENDGYLFATNHTLYPTLAKNGDGSANNIDFGSRNSSATTIEQVRDLFWSEPITNIWAIFLVQDTERGGGQFLGSSARLKTLVGRNSDFVRDAGCDYNSAVFYSGNSGTYQRGLIDGPFYCNGILRHPFRGYPYKGGSFTMNGGTTRYSPLVAEAHPLLPVAADCFATDSGLWNRNGKTRLCEIIIYTNKLTQAERLAVCGYLMDKWLECDVSCAVQTNRLASLSLDSSPHGFVLDADKMLYAGKVTGSGTFGKSGSGTMYVDCLDGRAADVVVSEGVLEINSRTAPTAADLPSNGMLFRMDATRKDLMRTTEENGVERIERWFSAHDGSTRWAKYAYGGADSSTNAAIYRANMLNGNAMLDFGTAFMKSDNKSISAMQYNRVTIRSVFMVQNTSNGGSVLVGDFSTWSAGGVMRDGWYLSGSGTGIQTGDFSDWSNALVMYSSSGRYLALGNSGSNRTRLNGEWMNPGTSGYSGGDDLVSYVSFIPITSNGYAYSNGHGNYCGGGMLGEYIAYSRGLSDEDALKVEAYLRKKWFNADTPGFTPAVASNLTVAAGATLNVSGGAPMTVSGAFSGGGTVNGPLVLAEDAVIEVPIAADDTVQTVTVNGELDLSRVGIVRLVGDASRLRGEYVLVSSPSLTAASAGHWAVEFDGLRKASYEYKVFVVDGALVMRVAPPGMVVILK